MAAAKKRDSLPLEDKLAREKAAGALESDVRWIKEHLEQLADLPCAVHESRWKGLRTWGIALTVALIGLSGGFLVTCSQHRDQAVETRTMVNEHTKDIEIIKEQFKISAAGRASDLRIIRDDIRSLRRPACDVE